MTKHIHVHLHDRKASDGTETDKVYVTEKNGRFFAEF